MVHSGKSAQCGSRDQDGGGGVCGTLTPDTVPGYHTAHPAMLHV